MLKLFDPRTARDTILKRTPIDETEVPEALLKSIAQLFGEPLTPEQAVERILKDVRRRGDLALIEWTQKLDGKAPETLAVPEKTCRDALAALPAEQRAALEIAAERVRSFHQKQPITSWLNQDMGGTVGQLVRPLCRAGVYVPGGSAPLPSTVLMSAIPAQVAGVSEIVITAPPMRGTGQIAPIILAAAALLGIQEVYAVGGSQAIAALAYGTETIRPVDKIVGPGNLFVTIAKRKVYGYVGIDSIAGPTETVVIADDTARPEWVAADLMAQAEHDPLAAAILFSPSIDLITRVQAEVAKQFAQRKRKAILEVSLPQRSGAILTRDLDEAVALSNEYAPEHLCLAVRNPWDLSGKVTAAGGIFLGEYSCEVLGDYVAGPSHVMPTGGSARFGSPLNVLDFIHIISLIALDETTARKIAVSAQILASAEALDAHAFAAQVRI